MPRHQVGSQSAAKIDMKGGRKNDETMMMPRMAEKLDIGAYGCARPACSKPRGGGRRRAKPLLQYSIQDWMKELRDECCHASPKPPVAQRAGGIFVDIWLDVFGMSRT